MQTGVVDDRRRQRDKSKRSREGYIAALYAGREMDERGPEEGWRRAREMYGGRGLWRLGRLVNGMTRAGGGLVAG